jgi:hypothetical protein
MRGLTGQTQSKCWRSRLAVCAALTPNEWIKAQRFADSYWLHIVVVGDRPFRQKTFRGFASPEPEQAAAHGLADLIEVDRAEFEAASRASSEFGTLLLESITTRA